MADWRPSPIEEALANGELTYSSPVPRWVSGMRVWDVTMTDTTTGERLIKSFGSQAKADGFIDEIVHGARRTAAAGHMGSSRKSAPVEFSVMDDAEDWDGFTPLLTLPITAQAQSGDTLNAAQARGIGGDGTKGKGRLKFRGVREVLEAAGLDPIAEIARVLEETKPVLVKGEPVIDEDGAFVTEPVIDPKTRLMTLTELAQYRAPKLKAVEHRFDTDTELSLDQIDAKIVRLAEKAQRERDRSGADR